MREKHGGVGGLLRAVPPAPPTTMQPGPAPPQPVVDVARIAPPVSEGGAKAGRSDAEVEAKLHATFKSFAAYGRNGSDSEMDGSHFAKVRLSLFHCSLLLGDCC